MAEGHYVRRYDRGSLRRAVRDESTGFLRVDASVTRAPAVFGYRMADGRVRRELRLPDDVFSSRNLDSIGVAKITDNHPPVRVTAKNVREYAVGQADGQARVDGEHAVVGLVIDDENAIAMLERGDKREVSLGYDVRIEHSSGVYNGQPYDVIQRDHVTNHIALVQRGRAGSSVRVHLDKTDAIQTDEEPMPDSITNKDQAAVKVDGIELTLPTSQANHIAKAFEQIEAKAKAATERADTLEAERDALQAKLTKIEETKTDTETPDVQALVDARLTLLEQARKAGGYTGDDADALRSMTDDEIRRKVVTDAGIDLTEKSDAYVAAAFDFQVANPTKQDANDKPHGVLARKLKLAKATTSDIEKVNDAMRTALAKNDEAYKPREAN